MYDALFLAHFEHPRHQGDLPDATHRGTGEDPTCGDRLWLDLKVQDGRVEEARFRVQGCVGAIAAGSAMTTLVLGREPVPGALTRAEIATELGEVPRAKRHALRLALSAWSDACSTEPVTP